MYTVYQAPVGINKINLYLGFGLWDLRTIGPSPYLKTVHMFHPFTCISNDRRIITTYEFVQKHAWHGCICFILW